MIQDETNIEQVAESKAKQERAASLRELFGSISTGNPTSADNEKIDEDLAREYANDHEDEN